MVHCSALTRRKKFSTDQQHQKSDVFGLKVHRINSYMSPKSSGLNVLQCYNSPQSTSITCWIRIGQNRRFSLSVFVTHFALCPSWPQHLSRQQPNQSSWNALLRVERWNEQVERELVNYIIDFQPVKSIRVIPSWQVFSLLWFNNSYTSVYWCWAKYTVQALDTTLRNEPILVVSDQLSRPTKGQKGEEWYQICKLVPNSFPMWTFCLLACRRRPRMSGKGETVVPIDKIASYGMATVPTTRYF